MQHTVSQQCFLDTTLYLTLFYATNSFLNRARTAAKRHRDGCQTEAFVLWQRVAIGQPPQSAKVQTREDCQFLLSNDRGCTSDICGCALSMHTSDVWAGHLAYASQPHPQNRQGLFCLMNQTLFLSAHSQERRPVPQNVPANRAFLLQSEEQMPTLAAI